MHRNKRVRYESVKEKQDTHTNTPDKNDTTNDHTKNHPPHLMVPYSFQASAISKFALLMYMSEFCCYVLLNF